MLRQRFVPVIWLRGGWQVTNKDYVIGNKRG
jgi:hypothetical protein